MAVKSKEGKFLGLLDRIKKTQVTLFDSLKALREKVFFPFFLRR
jgi:hypothetical protein